MPEEKGDQRQDEGERVTTPPFMIIILDMRKRE